ncbi:K+ channel tetramerization domain protein [Ostertagia ostertagi]
MSTAPIVLNVGGTKFSTSEATLKSRPASEDCFFTTLDYSKGEVFIDRDPTLFKYILNYLRDGRMMFPDECPHNSVTISGGEGLLN